MGLVIQTCIDPYKIRCGPALPMSPALITPTALDDKVSLPFPKDTPVTNNTVVSAHGPPSYRSLLCLSLIIWGYHSPRYVICW